MDNIFEQYGIREVANTTLYAIELDENDNEVYIPVLYMDTLKVSTVEEAKSSTSAQGGQGNPKLICWDYGKDITVTLEDALFTPASNSMNWCGELGTKKLKLQLRYFFDRNVDYNTPDSCYRTATLTAEELTDFMIIPDRWPTYEDARNRRSTKAAGYVGGTSIYCWMISGTISSNNDGVGTRFKDLILFYREQAQKWFFFNGRGYVDTATGLNKYAIKYQYGKEVFDWIKNNIAGNNPTSKNWTEYEPVANVTFDTWGRPDYVEKDDEGVLFLTQNLYIDGYRPDCKKDKTYGDITDDEALQIQKGNYVPYRYFANVGVEYNANITPPQGTIFNIDTAYKDVFYVESMDKFVADRTFCIDTDVNMKHSQYRYLEKYSHTPLTVYIEQKTMLPYQPNTFEYYRENGQRITGNLAVIEKGRVYYKWTRAAAKENTSVGKQLIIDAKHYPGVYRLVGETFIRDRYGDDCRYQFEIPLCKLTADNKISLNASGEPTVFTMKLSALRRFDGVMMKLTAYNLIDSQCPCNPDKTTIETNISPNPELNPVQYNGESTVDFDITINAEDRDAACEIIGCEDDNNVGFKKTNKETNLNYNEVSVSIEGDVTTYSIDETYLDTRSYNKVLEPDEYTLTIQGSDE